MDSSLVAVLEPVSGRDLLETIYLVSGIVLALVSCVGLWQLVLTKRDIQTRSRRESVVLAAEQCKEFGEKVIPNIRMCLETMSRAGIEPANWKIKDKMFNEKSFEDWPAAEAWLNRINHNAEVLKTATEVCNDLEAFAIYFMKGAADETVAFGSTGVLYCDTVQKLAPYLVMARSVEHQPRTLTSGPFQNVIDLYEMWIDRMTKKELEAKSTQMMTEARLLKDKTVDPIGTKG